MKKRGLNLTFKFSNRILYSLIAFFILAIIGVGVYAATSGATGIKPTPVGHLIEELEKCGNGEILQMAPDGTAWTCAAAGSGGIGTLSLYGATANGAEQDVLRTYQTTGSGGYIFMKFRDSIDSGLIGAYNAAGTATNGGWRNLILNEGAGNVGIGTTTPGAKLQVTGTRSSNVGVTTAAAKIGGADVHLYTNAMDADPWSVWMQVFNDAGDPLPLALNPTGGNVGIGTTNPTAKLDVNGNANVNGNLNVGGNININSIGGVRFMQGAVVVTSVVCDSSGHVIAGRGIGSSNGCPIIYSGKTFDQCTSAGGSVMNLLTSVDGSTSDKVCAFAATSKAVNGGCPAGWSLYFNQGQLQSLMGDRYGPTTWPSIMSAEATAHGCAASSCSTGSTWTGSNYNNYEFATWNNLWQGTSLPTCRIPAVDWSSTTGCVTVYGGDGDALLSGVACV